MAGLNYGNLFDRGMDFDDDGRARISTTGEDAARYKTIITETAREVAGGSSTIYTVPAGKVLYITNAWISGSSTNHAGYPTATLRHSGVTILLSLEFPTTTGVTATANQNINFSCPYKVPAAGVITIDCDLANQNARAGINGWLEDA